MTCEGGAIVALFVACAALVACDGDAAASCDRVAIVGDSLTALGNGELHAAIDGAIINARGGRLTADALEPVAGIVESNAVDCWVFALGTNDLYQNDGDASDAFAEPVAALVALAGDDRVLWVVPESRDGQLDGDGFERLIPAGVELVHVGATADDYATDGIHMTDAGSAHRASDIADALR